MRQVLGEPVPDVTRPSCRAPRPSSIGSRIFHRVIPIPAGDRNIAIAPKRCPPSTSTCGPNLSLITEDAVAETGDGRPYGLTSTVGNLAQRHAICIARTQAGGSDDGRRSSVPRSALTDRVTRSGVHVPRSAARRLDVDRSRAALPAWSVGLLLGDGRRLATSPRGSSRPVVGMLCCVQFGRPYSSASRPAGC